MNDEKSGIENLFTAKDAKDAKRKKRNFDFPNLHFAIFASTAVKRFFRWPDAPVSR